MTMIYSVPVLGTKILILMISFMIYWYDEIYVVYDIYDIYIGNI